MFCNNCGAYLEDGTVFCTSCGQAVNTKNGSQNNAAQTVSAQESILQRNTTQGNMPQGNMLQGNMPQGNMPQGNMPQESVMPQNSVSGNAVQTNQMQTAATLVNPAKPAQIFCGKCGSALQEGMQHCTSCGAPVGAAKKKRLNILALICWAALLLSLFLPYVSASADILGYSYSQELKLFDAEDGIFFIIISIVGIVLAVLKLNKISIAADIIAAGLVLFETINTQEHMSYMRGLAEYGVGFYLGIIAAIGLIISIFWNKIVKPK